MNVNEKQVGGSHYKTKTQPWDCVEEWGLGYLDGTALKYIARWRKKNGIEDLQKAIHFLEKLIEQEIKNQQVEAFQSNQNYWDMKSVVDDWVAKQQFLDTMVGELDINDVPQS